MNRETMSVLNQLAVALNRRDEVPNVELAIVIVRSKDSSAVIELVNNLENEDKRIQADCIKVLYEVGAREPMLIASYCPAFVKLLSSTNNRLVWGAMTALDSITLVEPSAVYKVLSKILAVADAGSVITRDHAVGILTKLGTMKQYSKTVVPLVIEQLATCPNNQLPMYADMSEQVITADNKQAFQKLLSARMELLEKESQKKRVSKVLKRLDSQRAKGK